MPFRLYNSLMGLAKESLQAEAEPPEGDEAESNPAAGKGSELVDRGPDTDPEVLIMVDKLKELLKDLPKENIATMRYIIRHLRKSVQNSTHVEIRFCIWYHQFILPSSPCQDCRAGGRKQDESQ